MAELKSLQAKVYEMSLQNLETLRMLTLRESTRELKEMFLSKPSDPHRFLSLFAPHGNHAGVCESVWRALLKEFHSWELCSDAENDALDALYPSQKNDGKEKDGKGKGKKKKK